MYINKTTIKNRNNENDNVDKDLGLFVQSKKCFRLLHDEADLSEDHFSSMEMGLEYLPDTDLAGCTNNTYNHTESPTYFSDQTWIKAQCPDFEKALQYTLSNWKDKSNPKHIQPQEYGFFSTIHSTVDETIKASIQQKQVYFLPLKRWAKDGRSFEIWLEPYPLSPSPSSSQSYIKHQYNQSDMETCKGVGRDIETHSYQRFIAVSQVLSILLQPTRRIKIQVNERMKNLHWNPQTDIVMGLYIRRGDACTEREIKRTKRTCDDLTVYVNDVHRVATKYNITKIYILSDGGDYIYNQTKSFSNYTWMFESAPAHSETAGYIEHRLMNDEEDAMKESNEVLTDFFTLASADVLIGKHTSNVFRAAVEYKSGIIKSRVPYVSIDAPWCFCFSCKGRVDKGPFQGETFHC